jgi:hypothetical protein
MLLSGMIWGYLIGTFCGLAAALSPSVQAFREEMTALNHMMSTHHLPTEMRFRLREYIHETVHLRNNDARNKLLQKLSPSMQGEVFWLVNQRWISKIWYLEGSDPELLIEIAFSLSALVFPPMEFCPCGFMYIIQRGTAFYGGRIKREASVWGDDVLLEDEALQINFTAMAASYLAVYTIDGAKLNHVIRHFPDFDRRLNPLRKRMRLRRAIVRAAEAMCYERGYCFYGRLRPIYARDVAAKMDRDAENRQSRLSLMNRTPVLSLQHAAQRVGMRLRKREMQLSRDTTRGNAAMAVEGTAMLSHTGVGAHVESANGNAGVDARFQKHLDLMEQRLTQRLDQRIEDLAKAIRLLGAGSPSGSPPGLDSSLHA